LLIFFTGLVRLLLNRPDVKIYCEKMASAMTNEFQSSAGMLSGFPAQIFESGNSFWELDENIFPGDLAHARRHGTEVSRWFSEMNMSRRGVREIKIAVRVDGAFRSAWELQTGFNITSQSESSVYFPTIFSTFNNASACLSRNIAQVLNLNFMMQCLNPPKSDSPIIQRFLSRLLPLLHRNISGAKALHHYQATVRHQLFSMVILLLLFFW
jgi:hypothetical protein